MMMGDKKTQLNKIKKLIAKAPHAMGVYLFMGFGEKVLYVGKAKDIKKRLAQHFSDRHILDPKKAMALKQILDIQWIKAPSEADALFMENQYIKRFQPLFNVLLRDDKAFPLLRLSLSHPFPKLELARKVVPSKDLFMGPYRSSALVKEMISICQRIFKIRSCSNYFFKVTKRPCLAYQLNRCRAPCVQVESKKHYNDEVQRMIQLLSGKEKRLLRDMKKDMMQLSKHEAFLEAKEVRDRIHTIEQFLDSQQAEFTGVEGHSDFMTVCDGHLGLLHLRYGVISGIRLSEKDVSVVGLTNEDILMSGLSSYGRQLVLPSCVYTSQAIKDRKNFQEMIRKNTGQSLQLKQARTPQELELMRYLQEHMKEAKEGIPTSPLIKLSALEPEDHRGELLRDFFRLERIPQHLECIDVSHFQGEFMIGVTVVFDTQGPIKEAYRYYKITLPQINDPAAIKEVCLRRYNRAQKTGTLPDVLLVDGGKGQLNAAVKALEALGLAESVRVCSIAKNRNQKYGGEKIYFPHLVRPILLTPKHNLSGFICQLRDEAHRFSIQYQRRRFVHKVTHVDELSKIPGMGNKRIEIVKMLLINQGPKGILRATQPPAGIPKEVWKRIQSWAKQLT